MPIAKGHRCADIGEFNSLLLSWLAETSEPVIGVGSSRGWVTVPIDGTDCQLAADTHRAGVEEYLRKALALPAPLYGVAPSSKGVVERIGFGTPPERIGGFYLYVTQPLIEPAELRPYDPPFDLVDAALLLLRAVRVLHEQGFQRLRIFPGISGSGMHWRTSVTYSDNFVDQDWGQDLRDVNLGYFWTTGDEFLIAGLHVARTTSPETLARALIDQLNPSLASGSDPDYIHWYAGLVEAARRQRRLPVAYNGGCPDEPGWEIDGYLRFSAPPPPS